MINLVIFIIKLYIVASLIRLDTHLFSCFELLGEGAIQEQKAEILENTCADDIDTTTEVILRKFDVIFQGLYEEESQYYAAAS